MFLINLLDIYFSEKKYKKRRCKTQETEDDFTSKNPVDNSTLETVLDELPSSDSEIDFS